MASAAPAIPYVMAGLGAVQTVQGFVQANAAADAQANAARLQADHQRQMMERQYEIEQRRRQNLLERSQARARAAFGARGLSTTDGSAGALLDGIQADAFEQDADARSMFDYRLGGLGAGLDAALSSIDARRPDLLSAGMSIGRQIGGIVDWGSKTFGSSSGGPKTAPSTSPRVGHNGYDPRSIWSA